MRKIVVMFMYDKLNVVGICVNENEGKKVIALITKLNIHNTLFSRNSNYKRFPENSCLRRMINKNVTIKLKKNITRVSDDTLLHLSTRNVYLLLNVFSKRLSLTDSIAAYRCLSRGVQGYTSKFATV